MAESAGRNPQLGSIRRENCPPRLERPVPVSTDVFKCCRVNTVVRITSVTARPVGSYLLVSSFTSVTTVDLRCDELVNYQRLDFLGL